MVGLVFVTLLVSITSRGAMPAQKSDAQTFHLAKTFSGTEPCTGEVLTGLLHAVFVVADGSPAEVTFTPSCGGET